MARHRERLCLAAVLWALPLGCSQIESRPFVDLSAYDYRYGIVAFLDRAGRATRVAPAHGEDRDGARFGSTELKLEDGDAQLLFVGLDDEHLFQTTPLFDPSRARELRLEVRALDASCAEGRYRDEQRFFETRLPEDALFLLAEVDDPASLRPLPPRSPALEALTLVVPIDFASCGSTPGLDLAPFGAEPYPLEIGMVLAGVTLSSFEARISDLVRLDDQRVLAMTGAFLFLLERGQPLPEEGTRMFHVARGHFDAMDAVPIRPGWWRMVLVGSRCLGGGTGCQERVSLLWELEVGDDGLQLVSTATVPEPDTYDVAIDDGGGVLVAGAGGIYSQTRPGSELTREDLEAVEMQRVEPLDPDRTVLMATGSAGRIYQRSEDRWSRVEPFVPGIGFTFWGFAAFEENGGRELWIGGTDGILGARSAGGLWREIAPVMDRAFAICPSEDDGCGGRRQTRSITQLVARPGVGGEEDHVLVAVDGCPVMLELRRSHPCGVTHALDDPSLSEVGASLERIDLRGGWLTVGSIRGSVFEARIGP